jgi:ADP-ribose pyrophosphatase YjhB (NUDIX family)
MPMSYCSECAHAMEEREAFGRPRPVCPRCGFVAFQSAKVVAGALVVRDGALLMTRRAHNPGYGLWDLPAGYMEADERLEEAAAREVREETGLEVRLGSQLGAYSSGRGIVLVIFLAEETGGTLQLSAESLELDFFPPDALPPLAFPETMAGVLADWHARADPTPRPSAS